MQPQPPRRKDAENKLAKAMALERRKRTQRVREQRGPCRQRCARQPRGQACAKLQPGWGAGKQEAGEEEAEGPGQVERVIRGAQVME